MVTALNFNCPINPNARTLVAMVKDPRAPENKEMCFQMKEDDRHLKTPKMVMVGVNKKNIRVDMIISHALTPNTYSLIIGFYLRYFKIIFQHVL